MYGKLFSSLYEGSMVGAGAHVFAVWGYCIANADPDLHTVRLNPSLLAVVLGESVERIESAIEYLSEKDDNSRCTDEEGRRLLHTSGMEYEVVSHKHYRDIKNSSDRKEYQRKYMRDYRKKKKEEDAVNTNVNNVNSVSLREFTPVSVSASVDDEYSAEFEECWKLYPNKSGKMDAYKVFKKDKPNIDALKDGIKRYKASVLAQRADGFKDLKYQGGGTWFNKRRWEDECEVEPASGNLPLGYNPKTNRDAQGKPVLAY